MEQLSSLAAALRVKIPSEQVAVRAESGEVERAFCSATEGLLLYRLRYAAKVELSGVHGDLRDILATLMLWLREAGGRADRFTGWDGTPVGDGSSDLVFHLELEEEVRYTPAAADYSGADRIDYRGQVWQRTAPEVPVARRLEHPSQDVEVRIAK